ncbi:hypothetical protein [Mycobacterium sp. SMC-4]|uniref:hypothetical protein n=1 Tax=Mycobacterium sp. SMC-4 TaxID=2857059 RepID=UPI0021B22E5E|nr:hypothetical protein [Mycobacterium sp. SMC-4]UXA19508.1 hypothetical protein KXD98_07885 [Mycobacterium sp. SMC-4]
MTEFICNRCQKPKACTPRRGMCPACYMAWHTRQHAYGRFVSEFVDAEPVRQHVAMLMGSGLTVRYIASAADVTRKAVTQLYAGRKGKALQRMSAANAEKLLAVQPATVPHAAAADHQPVGALGTRRRLQALVAFGYTGEDLAQRLSLTTTTLSAILTGRRDSVLAVTARAVEKLFSQLQTTPGRSQRARNRGTANGWPVPLAWDEDTIDHPAATPAHVPAAGVPFLETYSELRDELRLPDWQIARRLGIKLSSLERRLDRHGRSVSPELRALAREERSRQSVAS